MAVAVVLAAGRGERLGSATPKALVPLCGREMLAWSVKALAVLADIERVVVALPAGHLDRAPAGTLAVAGGEVRSESVRRGLQAAGAAEVVVVHDAARPLATPELFSRVLGALADGDVDAAIAALPVTDTIKRVAADGKTVAGTLDRDRLWAVQTPQAFRAQTLRDVLGRADPATLAAATDDAWLVERAGGTVRVVRGEPTNVKVTTQVDLRLAELLLEGRLHPGRSEERRAASGGRGPLGSAAVGEIATGIGYDCHRLVAGRALVLGGVRLEHELGLEGHSDADVLTHAIIDALLGAAALGDIGSHFPDTDERYRDADSLALLAATVELLAEQGIGVRHVDATVVLERPKLAGAREQIQSRLAEALGLDRAHVSVKATRGEGMGFVGRGEGAAAVAVATVARPGQDAAAQPA